MVLAGRNAVVHGGAGSVGGAVARAFARAGATVHVAGRTPAGFGRGGGRDPGRRRRRDHHCAGRTQRAGGGGHRNPIRDDSIGGFVVSLAAGDALRRQLAAELGSYGIRVLTIESGGLLETVPLVDRQQIEPLIVAPTMLGRTATLEDIGNVAVFAASDLAASMTGTILNTSCGASAD